MGKIKDHNDILNYRFQERGNMKNVHILFNYKILKPTE